MSSRQEVYEVINGERDYQDNLWGVNHKSEYKNKHEPSAFALYIKHYVDKMIEAFSIYPGDEMGLRTMRKVAALCVACMEQHGVYGRDTDPLNLKSSKADGLGTK